MRIEHRAGVRYASLADPADRTSAAVPTDRVRQETPHAFPQVPGALDALLGPALSELPQSDDAFHLQVWAPQGARGLPVLVIVPGGAFVSGAGTARWYDGSALAAAGMVVVAVNYRLGAAGVFGDRETPANRGLADLVVALRWIARHAGEFGGDAGAITVAGQSAGAWYALALAQHPQTAALVRRLALLSLPWQPPLDAAEYRERAATFFDALDGDLAPAPVEDVLAAQRAYAGAYRGGPAFRPAAGDGVPESVQWLPEAIRATATEAWWLTSTRDEAMAFLGAAPDAAFDEGAVRGFVAQRFAAPGAFDRLVAATPEASWKRRLAAATTLHEFEFFAAAVARAAAAEGRQVTRTRFELGSPAAGGASPHCFELPFVLGNADRWHDAPMLAGIDDAAVEAATVEMRGLLVGLVRDGRPGPGGDAGAAAPAVVTLQVTGDAVPEGWEPRYPSGGDSPSKIA